MLVLPNEYRRKVVICRLSGSSQLSKACCREDPRERRRQSMGLLTNAQTYIYPHNTCTYVHIGPCISAYVDKNIAVTARKMTEIPGNLQTAWTKPGSLQTPRVLTIPVTYINSETNNQSGKNKTALERSRWDKTEEVPLTLFPWAITSQNGQTKLT